ncbi:hypothetical protein GCM10011571_34500 [Marinithermofilum abyssi]|uniref:Uncharacterized protein n=1 Tax=Marinithermofilum abyssi TaxID=1571185 RepID=A0A8J2YEU9_9BACL|nr:hypothetical protein GCM10011571_34500 [Marinithermofilum abyssi]
MTVSNGWSAVLPLTVSYGNHYTIDQQQGKTIDETLKETPVSSSGVTLGIQHLKKI